MIELLQFRHSPYNEKVRWALDLQQLPHVRRSLLPGPHVATLKRLTGRTTTPVLVHDGVALDGSARIIEWLDAQGRAPRLLPGDAGVRTEAQRIERWFDEDLTPRIRRTVLAALLQSPRYFAAVFGQGRSSLQRAAYACMVPLAAPLVRRSNGIADAASIDDGHRAAEQALDFVAERAPAGEFLCGDALSVADLTAASALAMLVRPGASPMAAPQPVAPAFDALVQRYAGHPGALWVRGMYQRHRHATHDFDGPSAAAA